MIPLAQQGRKSKNVLPSVGKKRSTVAGRWEENRSYFSAPSVVNHQGTQRLFCIFCALENVTPPFLLLVYPQPLKSLGDLLPTLTSLCLNVYLQQSLPLTHSPDERMCSFHSWATSRLLKSLWIVSFKFYNNPVGLTRQRPLRPLFFFKIWEQNQTRRSLGAGLAFSTKQWECFYAFSWSSVMWKEWTKVMGFQTVSFFSFSLQSTIRHLFYIVS